jgi:hypothetical protein
MPHTRNFAFGILAVTAMFIVLIAACSKNLVNSISRQAGSAAVAGVPTNQGTTNTNGSGGDMPAYYDGELLTINFKEFPPTSEAILLAHNSQFNIIYQSDPGLPNNQPFISVIDAIPGGGFNPLWREVQIRFNAGFTPHQFFSDNDILPAAAGNNPEITLLPTTELYRCSVVGTK